MSAEQLAQSAAQTAAQASQEAASATTRIAAVEVENASLQQSVHNLISAAGAPSTAVPHSLPIDSLKSIIDTKILTRINTFDGTDESWRGWSFVFESTMSLINLEDVLREAVNAPETHLNYEGQAPGVQLKMKKEKLSRSRSPYQSTQARWAGRS